jgi:hypothetical protein
MKNPQNILEEADSKRNAERGDGLTDLMGFWGRGTWAAARRTRFSPGYQILVITHNFSVAISKLLLSV